ncbi:MAG: (2Fe-2S)-binding protein [Spirochaetes bacterium RBG_16_67_19]|nr:MAG: (2Fe-2S)-binding protein [Spirochaetes bacterium RBG_16_67_19]
MQLEFTCNGRPVRMQADGSMRALDLLRDLLGLTGTKEGCGRGECGACTILVDGSPVNACLLYAAKLQGRAVLTVEGLAKGEVLHPLQEAFLEEGAVQCGYCTPGLLLSSKALLDRVPHPTDPEIEQALSGNLCRCTGYAKILKAVQRAADRAGRGDGTSRRGREAGR